MLKNQFISRIQKGFKPETPGCLEHSFAMFEALLDAKFHQRQIVVSWLDLKNAYGSVRHNLIQFALAGMVFRLSHVKSFSTPMIRFVRVFRQNTGVRVSFSLILDFSRVVVYLALFLIVFSNFFLIY